MNYRSSEVVAMDAARHANFASELANFIGEKAVEWYFSSTLIAGLMNCALNGGPMKLLLIEITNEWIDRQKVIFLAEKENGLHNDLMYVSTNDIITAWHNRVCGSDLSLMTINCRNRVSTFTDNMAGNYQTSMIYNEPEDGCTPAAIRRSLCTFRNGSNSMPNEMKTLQWNCSLVTNWSSFYKQIDISDPAVGCICEYWIHFPVVEAKDLLGFRENATIFQYNQDRIGMLLATRSITADMLDDGILLVDSLL